jgi:hypothetical protein
MGEAAGVERLRWTVAPCILYNVVKTRLREDKVGRKAERCRGGRKFKKMAVVQNIPSAGHERGSG